MIPRNGVKRCLIESNLHTVGEQSRKYCASKHRLSKPYLCPPTVFELQSTTIVEKALLNTTSARVFESSSVSRNTQIYVVFQFSEP